MSRDTQVDGGKYNLPVFANQTRIDDLRRSRLREDDVLVVTYPKSGEEATRKNLDTFLKYRIDFKLGLIRCFDFQTSAFYYRDSSMRVYS